MADDKNLMTDAELDGFFAAAWREPPLPDGDFMARMMADADATQAAFVAPPLPEAQPGFMQALLGFVGGWPAVAGLATATVAGVWIGVSPPESVDALASSYFESADTYLIDFVPGFGDLFVEG